MRNSGGLAVRKEGGVVEEEVDELGDPWRGLTSGRIHGSVEVLGVVKWRLWEAITSTSSSSLGPWRRHGVERFYPAASRVGEEGKGGIRVRDRSRQVL